MMNFLYCGYLYEFRKQKASLRKYDLDIFAITTKVGDCFSYYKMRIKYTLSRFICDGYQLRPRLACSRCMELLRCSLTE